MTDLPKLNDFFLNIKRIVVAHDFTYTISTIYNCPKGRKTYGLIHILTGKLHYSFYDGRKLIVYPGETLFLKPDDAYKVTCLETCQHYTINFLISKSSIEGEPIKKLLSSNIIIINKPKNGHLNEKLFKDISTIWQQKNSGYHMQAISLLYKLFCDIVNLQNAPNKKYSQINLAKDYIETNWNNNFSLDDLSRICSLSTTHFRHLFLSEFHISPMQYRDSLRLLYAKDFLLQDFPTISEISYKCGFEDPNYFSRFFKKHTGLSPAEYKHINK